MANDPYCSNCSYNLSGLTESSKCPECGKPLVEVLTRQVHRGRRYKSDIMLFGLPLIHIATGPAEDGSHGRAKGIVAIGDVATGFIALGGRATGVVACGGLAVGLFSIGGLAVGLFAWGGCVVGGFATGGLALAVIAAGGLTFGAIAIGGAAFGYYAGGGAAWGKYLASPTRRDPEALEMFTELSWLLGDSPLRSMLIPMGWLAAVGAVLLIMIGTLMAVAYIRHRDVEDA